MKFPFVSRALFDEVNTERKKLLDLILKHQLGDTLYSEREQSLSNSVQVDPEKLADAKEEVRGQVKQTFSLFRRRPSLIAQEMTRRKEAEYASKVYPNTAFMASLEEVDKAAQTAPQA